MANKAIHIEQVKDMSTTAFIAPQRWTVRNTLLTTEEMSTVLTQIEAYDPSELSFPTPGHFLTGNSLTSLSKSSKNCGIYGLRINFTPYNIRRNGQRYPRIYWLESWSSSRKTTPYPFNGDLEKPKKLVSLSHQGCVYKDFEWSDKETNPETFK
ncbi:hypothetical protein J437_LFUL015361 [Ladona fulva]|uniref:Uncharacterized protein n=1 Tax=Ladona fulva TaxID=123851 RepID=A0A8K0KJ06_LADFU|nr:hypothetical protein J437_LFUL015361 [Ladona fulva]